MADRSVKKWLIAGAFVVAAIVAGLWWFGRQKAELPAAFAFGNGRIEAVEYDIATKQPGRIAKVLAREGDMVAPEQILAQMDTAELEADLRQAQAEIRMAREDRKQAEATVDQRESEIKQARAAVSQRRSDIKTAQAGVSQRNSELALAEKEFVRAQELVNKDFIARNEFDQAYTKKETAQAALLQEQARQRAVEAALTLGESAKVEELLALVESIPLGTRPPYLDAQAKRFRARMDGDASGYEAAAERFRDLGLPFWLAVTLLEHGELTGDESLFAEAREIFEGLEATPWLERLDAVAPARTEVPA